MRGWNGARAGRRGSGVQHSEPAWTQQRGGTPQCTPWQQTIRSLLKSYDSAHGKTLWCPPESVELEACAGSQTPSAVLLAPRLPNPRHHAHICSPLDSVEELCHVEARRAAPPLLYTRGESGEASAVTAAPARLAGLMAAAAGIPAAAATGFAVGGTPLDCLGGAPTLLASPRRGFTADLGFGAPYVAAQAMRSRSRVL